MKIQVLTESPADDAALKVILKAALGSRAQVLPSRRRERAGGYSSVLAVLRGTLLGLHYRHKADADALVVLIDSNHSPIHDQPLAEECSRPAECRLCLVRSAIRMAQEAAAPVPDRSPIKTAIGLAVPAIEAWYLCGRDTDVCEEAWIQGLRKNRLPYTKQDLKRRVYGPYPQQNVRLSDRAVQEMSLAIADLDLLERKFPIGFGSLLHDLRSW